jgi:arylsulfatase A-like enzyme
VVLLGALLLAKASVAVGAELGRRAGGASSSVVLAALVHEDALCFLAYAALDEGLARTTRRADGARWALCFLGVLYTAVNVAVTRVLSTPLTRAMVDAAGGALSDSIISYATAANLGRVAAVLFGSGLLARYVPPFSRRTRAAFVLAALGVALLGRRAAARVDLAGLERNAVLTLATTSAARWRGAAPSAKSAVVGPADGGRAVDLGAFAGRARGRDVVWVILESTAAEYLGVYGAEPDPTPNLARFARNAIVFDAAYSAYPESIKGLLSMLCSLHPAPYTTAHDYTATRAPCPSIAQALKRAGYRSAFFHSGRFRYLGMRGIVDGRGFDDLYDAETVGGSARTSFGTDDPSTVKKLFAFVDALPEGRRFFAVYSPISGHHPYRAPGRRSNARPERTEQDAYFNDLGFGDQAFGDLVDGFEQRGRLERTLFVVVGDHGEAFGRHPGNFAHTLFLYDENVRVPFLVAAPGLIRGELRAPQVTSLVDMAPTTLALLGLPREPGHAGRSVLVNEPGFARFLSDQGPLKLGFRSGRFKCIVETEHDRVRLFDVGRDPHEAMDLSAALPERAASCRDYLLSVP